MYAVLSQIGFKTQNTGSGRNSEPHIINAVQWDQAKYQCSTLTGEVDNTVYLCDVSNPVLCPGESSNFWWSIYNPDNQSARLRIDEMLAVDELGNNYTIELFNDSGTSRGFMRITSDPALAPQIDYFAFATIAPTDTGSCMWDYKNDKDNMPRAKTFNSMYNIY